MAAKSTNEQSKKAAKEVMSIRIMSGWLLFQGMLRVWHANLERRNVGVGHIAVYILNLRKVLLRHMHQFGCDLAG